VYLVAAGDEARIGRGQRVKEGEDAAQVRPGQRSQRTVKTLISVME
jgi:hypothetical protein